uniref:tRNA uridine 5-carboxymethylaminomethyl modification enzyme C-terminal subdomain domain-containing protein n=1 Tax=Spongospora subterranea TaxID=70186 RepID=A0A0H5R2Z6_9EUKA|eukprot:CRZ02294.1 hypothetical protein [Spongospora subterranea]
MLCRSESYIGVLVDDLVTKGCEEPYRIFTSRSEFRLSLRSDNADGRLTSIGINAGCIGHARINSYQHKCRLLQDGRNALLKSSHSPNKWSQILNIPLSQDGRLRSAAAMLSGFANVTMDALLKAIPELAVQVHGTVRDTLEVEMKYATYLRRQAREVVALRRDEDVLIPDSIDFGSTGFLSTEEVEKLRRYRPRTIGEANHIQGMTPSSVMFLLAKCRQSTTV